MKKIKHINWQKASSFMLFIFKNIQVCSNHFFNVIKEFKNGKVISPDHSNNIPEVVPSSDKNGYPASSLLDNKPFINLAEENIDLINQYEKIIANFPHNKELQMVIGQLIDDVADLMERSGVQKIESEETFNPNRHTTNPRQVVPDGAVIDEYITSGLCVENRVFRKAVVKIIN